MILNHLYTISAQKTHGARGQGRGPRLMLINTGGFTEQLRDEAASEGVLLIDRDMIFGRKDVPPL